MSRPPVRCVVVHRDRPERAAATVGRFLAQDRPVDVLVVDNASSPDAWDRLDAALPARVDRIRFETNTGFGGGANRGLRWWLDQEDGEWAIVAPHDAEFGPDAIGGLVAAAEADPRIGLLSADVGDGATPVVQAYLGALPVPQLARCGFEPTAYCHGTLMLLRRACVETVGLFDERYFAYCEEADLGLRATRQGWTVGIVRDVPVRNPQMGSSATVIDYLQLRNTLLLLADHHGRGHAAFRFAVAAYELVRAGIDPGRRPPFYSARGRRRALLDALAGRWGPPPPELVDS